MTGRRKRGRGALRLTGWMMLVLGSLVIVAWRQTEGITREQALREVQAERAVAEAERLDLERRVRVLTSRARMVRVARERLGMRLPSDAEIVLLPDRVEVEAAAYETDGGGR